jgi:hypothetical protein
MQGLLATFEYANVRTVVFLRWIDSLCTCFQARFAKWEPILQLQQSELDYSKDGIMMIPPTSDIFGRGVYHYVRSLALSSAAAHETGEA